MEEWRDKRVGVSLSAGYFGYYAHCGFMETIRAHGVTPVAMTGCSAGAVLGALWAAGMDVEEIRRMVLSVGPADLVDPPRLRELFTGPFGAIRGRRFQKTLADNLPIATFEECEIPLAVSVFDLHDRGLRVVASGSLARGVRASASMPGMFAPTNIGGHPCWDGALAERTPLKALIDRGGLDTILVCYLPGPGGDATPRSLLGGIRSALDALVGESDRRRAAEARSKGIEVFVFAPQVPRCGPHRMHLGPAIIEAARSETERIWEAGDFGCRELR